MLKERKIVINVLIVLTAMSLIILISLNDFSFNQMRLQGSITSHSQTSSYHDWSELSEIDNEYSYSTLFYSKNTEIYVNTTDSKNDSLVKYDTDILEDGKASPFIYLYDEGDEGSMILKNVGIDKDGNSLSAVLTIRVDKRYCEYNNTNNTCRARLSLNRIRVNKGSQAKMYNGTSDEDLDENAYETKLKIGYNMPLNFLLSAHGVQVETTLNYYKTSDLKLNIDQNKKVTMKLDEDKTSDISESKKIKYATISSSSVVNTSMNKINSFYWDVDVLGRNENDSYDYDRGHEGIVPLNGKSDIYYAKNSSGSYIYHNTDTNTDETVNAKLHEAHNGIFINTSSADDINIDTIWHATSTEFLTTGVNGSYKFFYGSNNAGIDFMFFSPKGYTLNNPIKSVSHQGILPNETFYFYVQQYLPNNYFSNVVDFSSLYTNFSNNNYISGLSFYDQINSDLTIDQSGITLTDTNGNDLSDYYNISVNNNVVTTTEKANIQSFYRTKTPYNNLFTLKIPVSYNKDVETKVIPNTGKTTTKIGDNNPQEKTTNEVRVSLSQIKLTYDCVTNGGEATFSQTTYPQAEGDNIDLSKVCKKDNYTFLGWSTTASGTDVLKSFTMPNKSTTLYGIYKPIDTPSTTCDFTITTKYTVDNNNKIIYVPNNITDAEILSNISSKATPSISNDKLVLTCNNEKVEYKISKFWLVQTGNNVLKYGLIVAVLVAAIVSLIIVNKKLKEE